MGNLKKGDAMRRQRVELLTWRAECYRHAIDRLFSAVPSLTDKELAQLDDIQLAYGEIQVELSLLNLQAKGGDVLNKDIADCFRDDIDIDKVVIRSIN